MFSVCGGVKPLSLFHKDGKSKDLHPYTCKSCVRGRVKKWKGANIDKVRSYNRGYREEHRDELNEYGREYYNSNREVLVEKSKKRYYDNLEISKQSRAAWRARNTEYIKRHSREYKRRRRLVDENFRVSEALRSRLNTAVRGKSKSGFAIRELGCSIPELRQHLEKQFSLGMSWENYGEWHIDHIRPLSSFDLTNADQLRVACHFTNLQPLWAEDNLKKGDKICAF
jgi:hypothetical protein